LDLQTHYEAQSNESFWLRPRNAALSRKINGCSLAQLNKIYGLQAENKADAVRHILYDGGFSYDGPLPDGALAGDPQFTSFYAATTRYSVLLEHLQKDVKPLGYDYTGRRQKSLYLQALAGDKKARESLNAMCHGPFSAQPKKAWTAIEWIMHSIYDDYLGSTGCPNRLLTHPMYPTIAPPLPNPVKLRGFVLRARKARDADTLSWMLGRKVGQNELLAENAEHLVFSVLNRFAYTSDEICAMKHIIAASKKADPVRKNEGSGGFLLGCFTLFSFISIGFWGIFLAACMTKKSDTAGSLAGMGMLLGVVVFLGLLCRVFRGWKNRPP
jgi:hypothetical protein